MWLYRVTQGTHVITGIACIPLLLVKLWSVYPNLFRWPAVSSLRHGLERLSVFVLVSSSLLQVATGFMNVLGWYAWPWHFIRVHHYLGYVVIGSVLLHIAVKLPDIKYGLGVKVADGDVLTEVPWSENPNAHSNAGPVPPPPTPALTRRGLLAATGAAVGIVVVTTVGQTLTPLRPLGLLAPRDIGRGPQGVPVNRTAQQAGVIEAARSADWALEVDGRTPYVLTLAESRSSRRPRHSSRSPASKAGASERTGAESGCSTWSNEPAEARRHRCACNRSRPAAPSTPAPSRARSSRTHSSRRISTASG